jgi:hypothetical protein
LDFLELEKYNRDSITRIPPGLMAKNDEERKGGANSGIQKGIY